MKEVDKDDEEKLCGRLDLGVWEVGLDERKSSGEILGWKCG